MDLSRTRLERLIYDHVFSKNGRKMLRLFWFDGVSYEAIAEELDISVSTVKREVFECEKCVIRHM